jgi:hypothetical protein
MAQEVIPPGRGPQPANERRNGVIRLVLVGAVIGAVAALVYSLLRKNQGPTQK